MNAALQQLSPGITSMIRMDHTHVLAVFHRYRATTPNARKLSLVRNACLALEVHAQLEEELFGLLNETGIGPMGLGGDVTVLNCHVEHADTHMTLNPVAVNYQCWAARRATAHVAADGTVDYDREA